MTARIARIAPTLDDVARVAGVSRATVSRAVRGDNRVHPDSQEAIRAAVEELGYVPNHAARSLASKRSNMVAVVASEPHRRVFYDPYFAISVATVAERLEGTPQHMAMHLSYGDYLRKFKEHLLGGHVDATVVVSHHDHEGLAEMLEAAGKPCVFLGRPVIPEGAAGAKVAQYYVDMDNLLGGRLAAQHLIEQGCTRIAHITGHLDTASGRDRVAGFRDVLAEAGLQPAAIHEGNYDPISGRTQVQALLDSGIAFDGLFVASDHMAVSALKVLTEHGIRVPDDVLLVGFDNAEISQVTSPTLTTLTNPWAELATAATERMLAELAGEPPAEPLILEPKLIARQSTATAK